ncbi:hypothetical protein SPURM210S_04148 [Streptomyces purpurascens]
MDEFDHGKALAVGATARTTVTRAPTATTTGAVPVTWQSRLKPSSIATNHVFCWT